MEQQETPRRAGRSRLRRGIWLGAISAYLVVRVLCTLWLPPVTNPDSPWYLVLDLSGRGRLWTVPGFFSLFPDDTWRIAAQSLVAGVAWVFATWAVSRRSKAAAVAVFLVGLMPMVAYWDRVIYSESLSISLMVTAFGACVRYRQTARAPWLALVVAAAGLWVLARPANIALGLLLCVLLAGAAAIRRTRAPAVAALALLVVVGLGAFLTSRNTYGVAIGSPVVRAQLGTDTTDTQTPNLAGIFATRVHRDPTVAAWFRDHGLPPLPAGTTDAFEVPAQREWIRANGARVYGRYLVTHPLYALAGPPRSDIAEMLTPASYFGSNLVDQRPPRSSVPTWVSDQLWSNAMLGFAAAVALVVVSLWRRDLFGLAMLVMVWANVLVTWHGSTAEFARLGVQGAILARLAFAMIIVAPVEALVRDRIARRRQTSGETAPERVSAGH